MHNNSPEQMPALFGPRKPLREGREKLEGGKRFTLKTDFEPAGDQPTAIRELAQGVADGERNQVLLGATGTGKTFTMAKVIEETQRPAIILAPNKTLAAQLYGEFKGFFPDNAVEYFVSYYDYYQPEAYVPRSDTYIEKESQINEQIDRMRHSATRALLERDDVIIVASVSCIYGIGSVETYSAMTQDFFVGQPYEQRKVLADLIAQQYRRNDAAFARGSFRVRGDALEIWPAHLEDRAWRLSFFGDELESITEFDPLTGHKEGSFDRIRVYANSHYVTPRPTMAQAIKGIKEELRVRLAQLVGEGKLLEAQRLEQRCTFDLEMLEATGVCNGVENYSRYLTGRAPGEPPPTLFEFIPDNAIVFADESHVSVPQIGGMFKGDFRRKLTLAEHGFRLPSCMDNRPLKFEEWDAMRPQSVFVSATPSAWELEQAGGVFTEQVIRPTGLVDPQIEVRPVSMQVDDLLDEIRRVAAAGYRILATVLTKRMAEDLTEYLHEQGIRVRYMHSDIDTIERIEILRDLRLGAFDVLVGINLLREGLDIPECGLVAILDADKEGFLRSETSLIQTIGRAARNAEGRVIMYADRITGSMERAMQETDRRREKQVAYNLAHGITPQTIRKNVEDVLAGIFKGDTDMSRVTAKIDRVTAGANLQAVLDGLRADMRKAAENLEFEEAARLRDEVKRLETVDLVLHDDPLARQQAVETAVAEAEKGSGRSTAGRPGQRGGECEEEGAGEVSMSTMVLPKPGQPSLLNNITCPYCGCSLGKCFDREHVIGRRFVPKRSLEAAWNLRVNSCQECVAKKAVLENDISAITLHPLLHAVTDSKREAEFVRKSGTKSYRTGKPVADSDENLLIKLSSGPVNLNFNMTSPPQLDAERAMELIRFQLQGFFYMLMYRKDERKGYQWPGSLALVSMAPHSDWGNERLEAFSKLTRDWDYRLAGCTALGYYKVLIKKNPELVLWSFAIEWNSNYRLAGFVGELEHYQREIEDLPFEFFDEMRNEKGHVLGFRLEKQLPDKDDLLFFFHDD